MLGIILHNLVRLSHLLEGFGRFGFSESSAIPYLVVDGSNNGVELGRVVFEKICIQKLAEGRPECGKSWGGDGLVKGQSSRAVCEIIVIIL